MEANGTEGPQESCLSNAFPFWNQARSVRCTNIKNAATGSRSSSHFACQDHRKSRAILIAILMRRLFTR